jgi:Flp pilus assembly protein TadG
VFGNPARLRDILRDRKGAAALEFVLVGGIFFIVMLAVIDLGRYYMFLHSARHATSEAGRAALIASACTSPSTVGNAARDSVRAGFLGPSFNLTATCSEAQGIRTWTITSSRPFRWIIPVFGTTDTPINETVIFTYRYV